MDVALVIGPWDLTFDEATASMRTTEERGFASWYLGDHFFSVNQIVSLEPYLLFALAARETERVRIGPLVTPVMFRPPSNVGRLAAQLDLLTGGRFVMGLGAGWNEAEHRAYGIPFPPTKERFDRLDEAVRLMRALWTEQPASFEGRFYRLEEAGYKSQPAPGRPPLLIGGAGERRTLRIAAEHADEWNCVTVTEPEGYAHKVQVLERHCEAVGRDPASIKRSMMSFGLVGPNEAAIQHIGAVLTSKGLGGAAAGPAATVGGTTDEVIDTLGRLAELGLDEIEFQQFDFDSDEVPEYLAAEVAGPARNL